MTLILCSGCARHVRRSEASCPFCSAPVVSGPEPRALRYPALTRAALLIGGAATLSVGAQGCADDVTPDEQRDDEPAPEQSAPSASMAVPAYGVAIDDFLDGGGFRPPRRDAATEGAADAGVPPDAGKLEPTRPISPPVRPSPWRDGGPRFQPAYGVPVDRE
jgi:hypothetical protein